MTRNLWLVRLGQFTLQLMANTNHKFPTGGGAGILSEVNSTVASKHHSHLGVKHEEASVAA